MDEYLVIRVNLDYDYVESVEFVERFQTEEDANEYLQKIHNTWLQWCDRWHMATVV